MTTASQVLVAFIESGLLLGAISSFAGVLAWWLPAFELVNEVRPLLTAAATVLFVASAMMADQFLTIGSAGLLIFNGALCLLPLMTRAKAKNTVAPLVRLVTFNVEATNQRYREIATFLAKSDADVVLVQETDLASTLELIRHCGKPYPYLCHAGQTRQMGLALFSTHAFLDTGSIERTARNPGVVWARFRTQAGICEVIGVYLAYPLDPVLQHQHIDWLIEFVRTRPHPLIIAGDFNLTPFSAKLTKFALATRLKRHTTLLASWPGHKWRPLFLIDHVFASPEFCSVDIAVGPSLASDHRPIIAEIGRDDGNAGCH